jgi:hypothetical protein
MQAMIEIMGEKDIKFRIVVSFEQDMTKTESAAKGLQCSVKDI